MFPPVTKPGTKLSNVVQGSHLVLVTLVGRHLQHPLSVSVHGSGHLPLPWTLNTTMVHGSGKCP